MHNVRKMGHARLALLADVTKYVIIVLSHLDITAGPLAKVCILKRPLVFLCFMHKGQSCDYAKINNKQICPRNMAI